MKIKIAILLIGIFIFSGYTASVAQTPWIQVHIDNYSLIDDNYEDNKLKGDVSVHTTLKDGITPANNQDIAIMIFSDKPSPFGDNAKLHIAIQEDGGIAKDYYVYYIDQKNTGLSSNEAVFHFEMAFTGDDPYAKYFMYVGTPGAVLSEDTVLLKQTLSSLSIRPVNEVPNNIIMVPDLVDNDYQLHFQATGKDFYNNTMSVVPVYSVTEENGYDLTGKVSIDSNGVLTVRKGFSELSGKTIKIQANYNSTFSNELIYTLSIKNRIPYTAKITGASTIELPTAEIPKNSAMYECELRDNYNEIIPSPTLIFQVVSMDETTLLDVKGIQVSAEGQLDIILNNDTYQTVRDGDFTFKVKCIANGITAFYPVTLKAPQTSVVSSITFVDTGSNLDLEQSEYSLDLSDKPIIKDQYGMPMEGETVFWSVNPDSYTGDLVDGDINISGNIVTVNPSAYAKKGSVKLVASNGAVVSEYLITLANHSVLASMELTSNLDFDTVTLNGQGITSFTITATAKDDIDQPIFTGIQYSFPENANGWHRITEENQNPAIYSVNNLNSANGFSVEPIEIKVKAQKESDNQSIEQAIFISVIKNNQPFCVEIRPDSEIIDVPKTEAANKITFGTPIIKNEYGEICNGTVAFSISSGAIEGIILDKNTGTLLVEKKAGNYLPELAHNITVLATVNGSAVSTEKNLIINREEYILTSMSVITGSVPQIPIGETPVTTQFNISNPKNQYGGSYAVSNADFVWSLLEPVTGVSISNELGLEGQMTITNQTEDNSQVTVKALSKTNPEFSVLSTPLTLLRKPYDGILTTLSISPDGLEGIEIPTGTDKIIRQIKTEVRDNYNFIMDPSLYYLQYEILKDNVGGNYDGVTISQDGILTIDKAIAKYFVNDGENLKTFKIKATAVQNSDSTKKCSEEVEFTMDKTSAPFSLQLNPSVLEITVQEEVPSTSFDLSKIDKILKNQYDQVIKDFQVEWFAKTVLPEGIIIEGNNLVVQRETDVDSFMIKAVYLSEDIQQAEAELTVCVTRASDFELSIRDGNTILIPEKGQNKTIDVMLKNEIQNSDVIWKITPVSPNIKLENTTSTGAQLILKNEKGDIREETFTITATQGSQKANLLVTLQKAVPYAKSIDVTGVSNISITSKEEDVFSTFYAIVLDQYGQTIQNPPVVWSVTHKQGVFINSSTGVLTVSSEAAAGDLIITASVMETNLKGEKQVTLKKRISSGGTSSGGGGGLSINGPIIKPVEPPIDQPSIKPEDTFVPHDVPEDHWAKKSIDRLIEKQIIKGDENTGNIRPDEEITKEEVSVLLVRVLHLNLVKGELLIGDRTSFWAVPYMLALKEKGIIVGDSDGYLNGNIVASRAEIVTMLARAMNITSDHLELLNQFSDSSAIPKWARSYFAGMIEKEYLKGYVDGTLGPEHFITRAEIFALLDRMFHE